MTTIDTMEDDELTASLLFTLDRLNDRQLEISAPTYRVNKSGFKSYSSPRKSKFTVNYMPMAAEWLRACGFTDYDINRHEYYKCMEDLVTCGYVDIVRRTYGTACFWRRFVITPKGREVYTWLMMNGTI